MEDMQIVERLAGALNESQISHMDVIPMPPPDSAKTNRYPFLVENGCLGIPLTVIPTVLKVAWSQLRQCTCAQADGWVLSEANADQISNLTQCIVALNPGHHTAWNWRKRMLAQGYILPDSELRLLDLLTTYRRNCKSDLLWHHRRWIVDKYVVPKIVTDSKEKLLCFWSSEAKICYQACDQYPRNYHCWVYRWWCLQRINAAFVEIKCTSADINQSELDMALAWIGNHPADYAAAHYFHILAESMCSSAHYTCQYQLYDIAQAELTRTQECLSSLYAGYESVWNHRRWCLAIRAREGKEFVRDGELVFLAYIRQLNSSNNAVTDLVDKHQRWLLRELS